MMELDELQDILEDIVPDDAESVIYTDEFIEFVLGLMEEFIRDDPVGMMEEDFHETLIHETFEVVLSHFEGEIMFYQYAKCKDRIDEISLLLHESFVPPRSQESEVLTQLTRAGTRKLTDQINVLRNKPQPEQRTAEWYVFRHNLITASNAYKLSFSRRFDDLECPHWPEQKFANAYGVCIDRTMYTNKITS